MLFSCHSSLCVKSHLIITEWCDRSTVITVTEERLKISELRVSLGRKFSLNSYNGKRSNIFIFSILCLPPICLCHRHPLHQSNRCRWSMTQVRVTWLQRVIAHTPHRLSRSQIINALLCLFIPATLDSPWTNQSAPAVMLSLSPPSYFFSSSGLQHVLTFYQLDKHGQSAYFSLNLHDLWHTLLAVPCCWSMYDSVHNAPFQTHDSDLDQDGDPRLNWEWWGNIIIFMPADCYFNWSIIFLIIFVKQH